MNPRTPSLGLPRLDMVRGNPYDRSMIINDAIVQLGVGFMVVAGVGVLLSVIGIAMVRASDRRAAAPELHAELDKTKTPVHHMYGDVGVQEAPYAERGN